MQCAMESRGVSHVKWAGMLVVSFDMGVNYGVWYHLGCSGENANIISHLARYCLGLHAKK